MRTTPPADRGGRVLRRTERSGRGRVAWLRWSSASVRRPRLRSTRARVRGDCVCRPKGASEHYVADYVRERAYDWPCISEPPLRSKAVVCNIRAIKCQTNDTSWSQKVLVEKSSYRCNPPVVYRRRPCNVTRGRMIGKSAAE